VALTPGDTPPGIIHVDQGARVPPGRDHSTSAGALHRDGRSSGAAAEDSQSSHFPEKSGGNPDKAAVDGVVVAEKAKEKEDTVCTLVERLKALAEVWEVRARARLLGCARRIQSTPTLTVRWTLRAR